ncbi:MAG TPA: hypothetical protein VKA48_08840 [Gammaproteobacteria bacterium]|nr:hypothetical protein [Gammaproteobacteria bacterium]
MGLSPEVLFLSVLLSCGAVLVILSLAVLLGAPTEDQLATVGGFVAGFVGVVMVWLIFHLAS